MQDVSRTEPNAQAAHTNIKAVHSNTKAVHTNTKAVHTNATEVPEVIESCDIAMVSFRIMFVLLHLVLRVTRVSSVHAEDQD